MFSLNYCGLRSQQGVRIGVLYLFGSEGQRGHGGAGAGGRQFQQLSVS